MGNEKDTGERDPKNINEHLKVEFEDVIAEPGGAYAPEFIWRNSKYLFDCSRNCCYGCMSVACALPCAFFTGCCFACLYFQQVWCAAPSLRHCRIHCFTLKNFLNAFLDAIIGPCCRSCGMCCSQIRVGKYELTGTEVI